jgi:hypothetical protein
MTAPVIPDSQGTTFTFNSVDFIAKNVKRKASRGNVDVTPLSATSGSTRVYQPAPLVDGDSITCEYWGKTEPDRAAAHTISCSALGITGSALCTDFELTAQVGEYIVGNASFLITGTLS